MVQVAAALHGSIIGRGGEGRRRLETETGTRLVVPRRGAGGALHVEGPDRRGVAAACSRIDVLVASARARQPFTHFLSVPLAVPGVQEAFTAWREAVLARSAALPSSLFQQPALLHLTFGTLALLDDREVELAGDLLEECGEQVVRPLVEEAGGLTIALRGLHYMNDDPSEVDVLYCNCGAEEESGRLQQMADQVVDRFVASGLMQREYERVKLHCTLLNSKYRLNDGDGGRREAFDARPLLDGWPDLHLGQVEVGEVHLSRRRAGRRTHDTGYYMPAHILKLGR